MAKEVVERAFEPFYTTKQSGQGTGLGLSQVYGFVKQSGGHIKIYSEEGEGTTVNIYMPRFFGKTATGEVRNAEPSRGRPGECVLVVEDDDDVRGYIVETLGALGYDVLDAADAENALSLLNAHSTVQLLLTDVVISRNAIVHQGRLDPGVALIQKPLSSEQLAAAVRKVLDA